MPVVPGLIGQHLETEIVMLVGKLTTRFPCQKEELTTSTMFSLFIGIIMQRKETVYWYAQLLQQEADLSKSCWLIEISRQRRID
jgi:hypothetical protein